jgi:hypothetical protein
MAFALPPLPQQEPTWPQMQAWWQQVIQAVETQENTQDDLIQQILDAQATADEALTTAQARMPAISPIIVTADSAGTVNPGQLPRSVQFRRYDLTTDVTASSDWSATLLTGSATFSMGAATGILEITALATSATIEVQSVRNGVTLTVVFEVNKENSAGSGGSGGGSSASDSSLSSFNSASHAAVSDELTVVAGAGGIVTLTAADLIVATNATAPDGVFAVYGQWQWDSTGAGAWVDLAAEQASDPHATVDPLGGPYYQMEPGYLTANDSKTGLVAASSHKFRFMARNSSGTRTMYLSGTVSAVGS